MSTERWRAEAERLAIEWTRPPYVRIFGQPHDDDSDGDVYLEIDKDALRDAILRLIERVERETRQSIADALADRVDVRRGGDEDAVYAHAVSIALTPGAAAASPFSQETGAVQSAYRVLFAAHAGLIDERDRLSRELEEARQHNANQAETLRRLSSDMAVENARLREQLAAVQVPEKG